MPTWRTQLGRDGEPDAKGSEQFAMWAPPPNLLILENLEAVRRNIPQCRTHSHYFLTSRAPLPTVILAVFLELFSARSIFHVDVIERGWWLVGWWQDYPRSSLARVFSSLSLLSFWGRVCLCLSFPLCTEYSSRGDGALDRDRTEESVNMEY